MKQSLQLKLGQQLTMTPQLQQAIRLLQLSTLDLQQEIQEALESNPMLERQEEGEDFDNSDPMADGAESATPTPRASAMCSRPCSWQTRPWGRASASCATCDPRCSIRA